MMKQFGLCLLLVFLGTGGNFLFGQERGGGSEGSVPQVIIHPTINHGTCFNQVGSLEYYVEVSTGWTKGTKINRLDLYDESWTVVEPLTNNGCCGAISNLPIGMYTFYGSMTVQTSTGMLVSVPLNHSIWIGIQTVWLERIDMITSPNSYSAIRNGFASNYGGVSSSNGIDSGDNGWVEMQAQYGSTSDNRVFWLIGDYDPLGTFNPSANIQYIEFFKGSGGNGISLNYSSAGGMNTYSLSNDPYDKIRLVKNGTTLTIQKNDDPTTVFTLPTAYSSSMNIAVRALAESDGPLNVVSSFPCRLPKIYANLKYKLDGFHHTMKDGKIRFVFDQEYDTDYLKFNIYNHIDILVKDQTDFPAITATNGDNYLTIDVSDDIHCIGRGFFYLEVINSKKEKSYLRFFNDFSNPLGCIDYVDSNGNPSND